MNADILACVAFLSSSKAFGAAGIKEIKEIKEVIPTLGWLEEKRRKAQQINEEDTHLSDFE